MSLDWPTSCTSRLGNMLNFAFRLFVTAGASHKAGEGRHPGNDSKARWDTPALAGSTYCRRWSCRHEQIQGWLGRVCRGSGEVPRTWFSGKHTLINPASFPEANAVVILSHKAFLTYNGRLQTSPRLSVSTSKVLYTSEALFLDF